MPQVNLKGESADGEYFLESDQPGKRRRNRTTQSCLNCHTSKRKCDRKRPCQRCIQLGLTGLCVYEIDDPALRDDPTVDEVTRLKNRIAELESLVRELRGKPHPKWADANAQDDTVEKWHSRSGKRRMRRQTPELESEEDELIESPVRVRPSASTSASTRSLTPSPMPVVVKTEPLSVHEFEHGHAQQQLPTPPQFYHSFPNHATPDAQTFDVDAGYSDERVHPGVPIAYNSQLGHAYSPHDMYVQHHMANVGAPYVITTTMVAPSNNFTPGMHAHPNSVAPQVPPCACCTHPATAFSLLRLSNELASAVEYFKGVPEHAHENAEDSECLLFRRVSNLDDLLHGRALRGVNGTPLLNMDITHNFAMPHVHPVALHAHAHSHGQGVSHWQQPPSDPYDPYYSQQARMYAVSGY